jgi:glycosyltransferase involved in cell wall biosynthesis
MKIAYFTSYVHEQGTYFRYHNLARALVDAGHEVTVFGCDTRQGAKAVNEIRSGVNYSIVAESWKTSIFSQGSHPLTSLRRYFKNYGTPDIAHVFQPFLAATMAWTRCRARVKFYDWDDQWTNGLLPKRVSSWRQVWPKFIMSYVEQRMPAFAKNVTVVSEHLKNKAIELGAKKVYKIYNGYWPGQTISKQTARTKFDLREDAFYVGFMGRTTAELDWCFRAVEQTYSQYPRLRFALCGPPQSCLNKLSGELRSRIDFLGSLNAEDCKAFASAIDLGLLPLEDNEFNRSRYPIKFCEHLITGNSLLCSPVGEISLLADRFPNAIIAQPGFDGWMSSFSRVVQEQSDIGSKTQPASNADAILSWKVLGAKLESAYADAFNRSEKRL